MNARACRLACMPLLAVSVVAMAASRDAATSDDGAAKIPATCLARSEASVAAMVAGRFTDVGKDFAPAIASQFPPAKIEQAWQSVQASAGTYRKHGVASVRVLEGQPVVVTPVDFAHAAWDFVYACDHQDRITTARLMPTEQLDATIEASRRAAEARSPIKATVGADGVRVEPLSVPSRFGPLRGALTLPVGNGPFPAVVLVGGSGPSDLDEAVGGSKPFRDIALGLARLGIASLRYDKRQVDYPAQMAANAALTVDEEVTDDALAAAKALAEQKQVDPRKMFVLGHSEGGMLAPRIGARDPALAGIIMLAAPARRLLAVMQEQTREQGARLGLPQTSVEASEQALAGEQALLDKASPGHPPQGEFGGAPQSWWLSLHDYDQVATAESLSMPMLFLQGGSDFQVSPRKDFEAWKQALAGKPDVAFRLYPGLSHLFTPAGKALTTADYSAPAHVDPAVIGTIAKWIKAQHAE